MKIKELLTDSSKWTKDTPARDKNGIPVQPTDPNAVSWCLLGAISKCYDDIADYTSAMRLIRSYLHPDSIVLWNDDPTRIFADVKQLVTRLDI